VDEELRLRREVEVDDIIQQWDVNASCRNISDHKELSTPSSELGDVDFAGGLHRTAQDSGNGTSLEAWLQACQPSFDKKGRETPKEELCLGGADALAHGKTDKADDPDNTSKTDKAHETDKAGETDMTDKTC
jgi:hypothetical protein